MCSSDLRADDIYEFFITRLFEEEKDCIELIKIKEIMYELEKTTDAAEHVGEGPKVMFAAHLDSIGLIVTHIESAGFLRVAKIGGVRPEKILHSLVRFENGTIGTIASSGTDLGKLSMEDLYVDIGAESREEAEKKVSVGDAAVYMGQPVQTEMVK